MVFDGECGEISVVLPTYLHLSSEVALHFYFALPTNKKKKNILKLSASNMNIMIYYTVHLNPKMLNFFVSIVLNLKFSVMVEGDYASFRVQKK